MLNLHGSLLTIYLLVPSGVQVGWTMLLSLEA